MKELIIYGIAVVLIVASFFIPPLGVIDNSVLMAAGIMIAGYQLMFGHSIKEITLDRNGLHIETYDKPNDNVND